MKTWHVWTDGSVAHVGGGHFVAVGARGHGGWAAIVECGSSGWVLRGREPKTTNMRMEMRAAVEGLKAVRDGQSVVLHTDTTGILTAKLRYDDHRCCIGPRRPHGVQLADQDLLLELTEQFDRVEVKVELAQRGGDKRDPRHRRAHLIAGAEARQTVNKDGLTKSARKREFELKSRDIDDRRLLTGACRAATWPWRDRVHRVTGRPSLVRLYLLNGPSTGE